jgi:hypothetical protein
MYHECGHSEVTREEKCQAYHVSEVSSERTRKPKKQSWFSKLFCSTTKSSSSSSSPSTSTSSLASPSSRKSCRLRTLVTNVVDFCPTCEVANFRQRVLNQVPEEPFYSSYSTLPSERYREAKRKEQREKEAFEEAKRKASAAARGYPGWEAGERSSVLPPGLISSFFSTPGTNMAHIGQAPPNCQPVKRKDSPKPQSHDYLDQAIQWQRWEEGQRAAQLAHKMQKSRGNSAPSQSSPENNRFDCDLWMDSSGRTRLPPPREPLPALPCHALTRSNATRRPNRSVTTPQERKQQQQVQSRPSPPVHLTPVETDIGLHKFHSQNHQNSPVSPPGQGDSVYDFRTISPVSPLVSPPVSPPGVDGHFGNHTQRIQSGGRQLSHFPSSLGRDIDSVEEHWNGAAREANYRNSTRNFF